MGCCLTWCEARGSPAVWLGLGRVQQQHLAACPVPQGRSPRLFCTLGRAWPPRGPSGPAGLAADPRPGTREGKAAAGGRTRGAGAREAEAASRLCGRGCFRVTVTPPGLVTWRRQAGGVPRPPQSQALQQSLAGVPAGAGAGAGRPVRPRSASARPSQRWRRPPLRALPPRPLHAHAGPPRDARARAAPEGAWPEAREVRR